MIVAKIQVREGARHGQALKRLGGGLPHPLTRAGLFLIDDLIKMPELQRGTL